MNEQLTTKDQEAYRDSIATVDQKGKRLWIYPKKPKGKFTQWRTYVSWGLLAILVLLPFVKLGGEPLFLLNVLERKFILFGILFLPQDFHLFVLAMLTLMVFIILFTVVFGRLFCGWICPQTIFMEMVFRKIEYWIEGDANAQRRLSEGPWTSEKVIKKVGKQMIFFTISVLVANLFLSYIIGVDEVIRIATEPIQAHIGGFLSMLTFSFVFFFVFSWMREQVCIAICPYGRLQGVLLDQNSILVHYDFVRGEPRGKIRKNRKKKKPVKPAAEKKHECVNPCANCKNGNYGACKSVAALEKVEQHLAVAHKKENGLTMMAEIATLVMDEPEPKVGDCIDCGLCVKVCPTGIDIRNGTQLECINCTACMDACDEVMVKVKREPGLIRYDSYQGVLDGNQKLWTPRVIAYTVVLGILLLVNVLLLSSRTDVETLLLRTPGMLFQQTEDNQISNLYNYQVINKTTKDMPIELFAKNFEGTIEWVGSSPTAKAGKIAEGALFIRIPNENLIDRKTKLIIEVQSNGKVVDLVKTNFLGPIK
ncbi:MAG: 4Fe-4S dicluster domain-containing protein [Bacteroidota bacterium]